MSIDKLLTERGQVVNRMREILDRAEAEGRDLNTEEVSEYGRLENRQSEIKNAVDRRKSFAELEQDMDRPVNSAPKLPVREGKGKRGGEYANAFDTFCRVGKSVLSGPILSALQVGTDSEGGYIVPEEFDNQLIQALQDINEIRQFATVIRTASDRNIPVESSLGTATWTAEEAAYTESDPVFGTLVLGAHKLGTILKVSEELLQDSAFDLQAYLASNFGKRFGIAEEAAFVNGNGTGKPTGLVQGASAGVTAASASAITADEVVDMFHSLGRPYRGAARWVMNDATAKLIRKLKDGQNQYIWQPGLQAGQPDTILGRPVLVSSAMPTAAVSAVTMLFGDLSYYTIADRTGAVMQRLNELYAANGQVGFRMYKRTDGKVTLSAAIKKLTMAAA